MRGGDKSKKKDKGGEGTEKLSERSGKIWYLSSTCMKRGLRPWGHLGKGLPGTWKRQGEDRGMSVPLLRSKERDPWWLDWNE